jgi:hypothetical protein
MTNFVAPWSPNFTNDINDAITTVTDVLNTVVPGVLPTPSPGPVLAPVPTPDPTQVTPYPTPYPTPTPSPYPGPSPAPVPSPYPGPAPAPTPAPPIPTTNVPSVIESSVTEALKNAWPTIQPQLQADAMAYVQSYIQQVLAGNPTPQIPNITYNGQSLTQSAAKGHAWRTFLLGMGASAISAVLAAIGSQTNLDFFSKSGWIATGSIAVATLVQTVASYIARLQVTPEYEKQMIAAPPSALDQIKK